MRPRFRRLIAVLRDSVAGGGSSEQLAVDKRSACRSRWLGSRAIPLGSTRVSRSSANSRSMRPLVKGPAPLPASSPRALPRAALPGGNPRFVPAGGASFGARQTRLMPFSPIRFRHLRHDATNTGPNRTRQLAPRDPSRRNDQQKNDELTLQLLVG